VLRAIVFDFDGVIANSEPLHFTAFRDVLAGEGIALTEADYYARYLGYDDVGMFQAIGAARGGWAAAEIAGLVARKAVRLEELERGPTADEAEQRLAVFGSTDDDAEPHFLGWRDEVDPDELFESGRAWGLKVMRRSAA